MLKKITAAALAAVALLTLVSCTGTANNTGSADSGDKITVVCTVFPQYDWVKKILGNSDDAFELILLLSNGADMHSFQPSVGDIVSISDCDLFIHIGGESEVWVADALSGAVNSDMVALNLLEVLGDFAKLEEIIPGMQAENEEDAAPDEHIWLSVKNAQTLCRAIADELIALKPEQTESFESNLGDYLAKLDRLDLQYSEAVDSAFIKTLLFGDRFPFRYLVDDYGIDYYAAFPGCSAETEAAFDTIIFLVEKLNALDLNCVMVTESSDMSIARTIIENSGRAGCGILTLDSMQSVTQTAIENGAGYISIMEKNLESLKAALNNAPEVIHDIPSM